MAQEPARPGEAVNVRLDRGNLTSPEQLVLVDTGDVQIAQLIIPAGAELPTHQAQGEIVLHCLQGHVEIAALEEVRSLKAGQLLYLTKNEPFSIRGVQDASLLATIIQPKQGPTIELVGS